MAKSLLMIIFICFVSMNTYGQVDSELAKVDVGVSYSYLRLAKRNYSGVTSSANYNLNRYLSLGTEFSYFEPTSTPRGELIIIGFFDSPANPTPVTINLIPDRIYSLSFGPKLTYRDKSRLSMFAEGLVGFYRAEQRSVTFIGNNLTERSISKTELSAKVGGGLDLKINQKVSLRLIQADYVFFKDFSNGGLVIERRNINTVRVQENAASLSFGVIFHFGK